MAKPRKKYRPKYIATNPMSTFLGGMSGEHAQHLQDVLLKNHTAMSNMARGVGGRDEWDRLNGMINMANVMCDMGIGDEFRQATVAARDALLACGKRGVRTGRFLFTGDELVTMNEAMSCHEAQMTNVRAIDVERAMDEVAKRLRHHINTTTVQAEMAKEVA